MGDDNLVADRCSQATDEPSNGTRYCAQRVRPCRDSWKLPLPDEAEASLLASDVVEQ